MSCPRDLGAPLSPSPWSLQRLRLPVSPGWIPPPSLPALRTHAHTPAGGRGQAHPWELLEKGEQSGKESHPTRDAAEAGNHTYAGMGQWKILPEGSIS